MLRAISLYTGVGGLDFGLEAAGIRTAVAVEMDPACCRTLRLNRRWPVIEGDIHEVSSASILAEAGVRRGEADLLVGGPPCQPFSKSSYWVSGDSLRLDDPRADTLSAYLRVLRDTRPRAFLLENVYGLAYKGKSEGMELLLRGISEINKQTKTNYSVQCAVLNAADYGVPQTRERVFLIGSRDGTTFRFPNRTHAVPDDARLLDAGLEPHRTAWDAIGDLTRSGTDEKGAGRGGAMGRAVAVDSRRTELPLAHATERRPTALWMANPILVVPVEACQEPAFVDDSGSAGSLHRALPLEQPAAHHARDVPPPDLPSLAQVRVLAQRGAEDARQRRALVAR